LLALSLTFQFGAHAASMKWVAFGSMVLYIACFAMSLGPIMWLMIAECFPLEIRGIGSSVVVSGCWGFNMVVAMTFLTLIQSLGAAGTFLIYSLLCLVGIFFVYAYVPETKGVGLEQIEENLRSGASSRQMGQRKQTSGVAQPAAQPALDADEEIPSY